jgi:ribosomal protein L16/L10AE
MRNRAGGAEGKGDHEIWYSPIAKCRFMVDFRIKSRHWANHTLKQAGLKAF